MKTFKRICIVLIIVIGIIFINGCYFVFYGQHKAAQKLENHQELNTYEIFSTYTMHIAICTISRIYGKEVAKEYIGMSFKRNRNTTKYVNSNFFLSSPIVKQVYDSLSFNNKKRIAFRDTCYSLHNPNCHVALAANPGYLIKLDSITRFIVPVHYPYCTNTKIYISKDKYILMNESLFNYLEKIHLLHPYTIIYFTKT